MWVCECFSLLSGGIQPEANLAQNVLVFQVCCCCFYFFTVLENERVLNVNYYCKVLIVQERLQINSNKILFLLSIFTQRSLTGLYTCFSSLFRHLFPHFSYAAIFFRVQKLCTEIARSTRTGVGWWFRFDRVRIRLMPKVAFVNPHFHADHGEEKKAIKEGRAYLVQTSIGTCPVKMLVRLLYKC